ncbi:MAG: multicopper oxidase domain-containing protein, partial [Nitrospira sp.]|nr:multicopper oxidase domain-containing protein [Nitrospira sp.]
MYHGKSSMLTASAFLALFGGAALVGSPPLVSAENGESQHVHSAGMNAQSPGWAERLKGQTIVEDSMEGRAERAALVEQQHNRLMEQMQKDMEVNGQNSGAFNSMSMIHQYGAGQGTGLLSSTPGVEPVSMKGGLCPKTAPVRNYDVSAINAEITLNQWLDYYPGYMYVLTENIDKVREEEAKNAAARETEGHHNPGAVKNGIQDQWIQPLVIRGNQGDCVKITLRNQLEFGEEVSLHVNGSDMVMSKTGQPATTTNLDTVAAEGGVVEMEWYIHPDTQEGGRQFHTYSNDRELTVMGLFGVFVVEPRNSEYWEPLGTGPATKASSGWQVMIENGTGPDFREFVLIYHEVGAEAFRPVNKHGDF